MGELRLRTFGGVLLEGPVGAASTQRRRLAFLALLAASDAGVSRDQLVGYLWPDTSEERAKHALAQLLYSVRREFGEDVVQADSVNLRLSAAVLPSDVADFRAAIAGGDYERAVALHSGPFLDGFYLTACPEFERWSEETRGQLLDLTRDAIQRLATAASQRGDLNGAVNWLRRLTRVSPLDARVALSLMKGLVAAGDRAGALETARLHEALVRSELDAPADPAISAFVAELKSAPPTPPVRPVTVAAISEPLGDTPAAVAAPTAAPPAAPVPRSGPRTPVRWQTAATFILGLASLAALGAVMSNRSESNQLKKWVLIADAQNATGDSALDRTLPVALAAALAQSKDVYPVPPDRVRAALIRMRRPGADSVLNAELAREIAQREGIAAIAIPVAERSGSGFELSVKIVDPETGGVSALPLARAKSRATVIDALDELSRKLRRDLGESRSAVARNSTPLPLVTTSSLDALRKYADGVRAFNRAKYPDAMVFWDEAIRLDPKFSSAYASLGMLAYFLNSPADGAAHFARALELLDSLPERERVRIRSLAESERGNRAGAVAVLAPYLSAHDDDLDLWNQLAYNYMRLNRDPEAEHGFRRSIALDSLNVSARINLASVLKRGGRFADALVEYRKAFALDPAIEIANNNVNLEYAATYVANGQPDSARAVIVRMLEAGDPARRARALRSLAFLDMHLGHFAAARDQLTEAASIMSSQRAVVSEVRNRVLAAQAFGQLGDGAKERRSLDSAATLVMKGARQAQLLLFVGKPLARNGQLSRATEVLKAMEKSAQPDVANDVAALETLRGEVLLAQRKTPEALPHLRAGISGDPPSYGIESLAFGLAAAGMLDSAAARYAELDGQLTFGHEAQLYVESASYWHGRVQERRNEIAKARALYQRYLDRMKEADSGAVLINDARARLSRLASAR